LSRHLACARLGPAGAGHLLPHRWLHRAAAAVAAVPCAWAAAGCAGRSGLGVAICSEAWAACHWHQLLGLTRRR